MTNRVLKGGICVGSVHDSLSCGKFKVVDIKSSKNVVVEFLETGFKVNVQAVQIRLGTIKDKMSATYYGVGITGNKYPVSDGKGELTKAYLTWSNMIRRCFSESYDKRYQTYKDCTCSENFKHYEYFYEWCNKQVGFENKDWHMDKDILIKGNKIYSEDTCCFVPREINNLLTTRTRFRGEFPIGVHYSTDKKKFVAQISKNDGQRTHLGLFNTPEEAFYVYKDAKEAYIKEVAEKWKNLIDARVYEALINYKIELGD